MPYFDPYTGFTSDQPPDWLKNAPSLPVPEEQAPQGQQGGGFFNAIGSGLSSGFHGLLSDVGSAVQGVGSIAGLSGVADWGQQVAQSQQQAAQSDQRADLEENMWSPSGLAYKVAQAIPGFAPAVLGTIAANAIPGVGQAVDASWLARLGAAAPRLIGGGRGLEAADAALAGQKFARGVVGAGAGLLPQTFGGNVQAEQHGDLSQTVDRGQALAALAVGAPEAAIAGLFPESLLSGKGELLGSKILGGVATGGLTSGLNAGLQTGLNQFLADDQSSIGDRAQAVVDSALQGGVIGGIFGGALSLFHGKPAEQVTNEELKDAGNSTGTAPAPPSSPPPPPPGAGYAGMSSAQIRAMFDPLDAKGANRSQAEEMQHVVLGDEIARRTAPGLVPGQGTLFEPDELAARQPAIEALKAKVIPDEASSKDPFVRNFNAASEPELVNLLQKRLGDIAALNKAGVQTATPPWLSKLADQYGVAPDGKGAPLLDQIKDLNDQLAKSRAAMLAAKAAGDFDTVKATLGAANDLRVRIAKLDRLVDIHKQAADLLAAARQPPGPAGALPPFQYGSFTDVTPAGLLTGPRALLPPPRPGEGLNPTLEPPPSPGGPGAPLALQGRAAVRRRAFRAGLQADLESRFLPEPGAAQALASIQADSPASLVNDLRGKLLQAGGDGTLLHPSIQQLLIDHGITDGQGAPRDLEAERQALLADPSEAMRAGEDGSPLNEIERLQDLHALANNGETPGAPTTVREVYKPQWSRLDLAGESTTRPQVRDLVAQAKSLIEANAPNAGAYADHALTAIDRIRRTPEAQRDAGQDVSAASSEPAKAAPSTLDTTAPAPPGGSLPPEGDIVDNPGDAEFIRNYRRGTLPLNREAARENLLDLMSWLPNGPQRDAASAASQLGETREMQRAHNRIVADIAKNGIQRHAPLEPPPGAVEPSPAPAEPAPSPAPAEPAPSPAPAEPVPSASVPSAPVPSAPAPAEPFPKQARAKAKQQPSSAYAREIGRFKKLIPDDDTNAHAVLDRLARLPPSAETEQGLRAVIRAEAARQAATMPEGPARDQMARLSQGRFVTRVRDALGQLANPERGLRDLDNNETRMEDIRQQRPNLSARLIASIKRIMTDESGSVSTSAALAHLDKLLRRFVADDAGGVGRDLTDEKNALRGQMRELHARIPDEADKFELSRLIESNNFRDMDRGFRRVAKKYQGLRDKTGASAEDSGEPGGTVDRTRTFADLGEPVPGVRLSPANDGDALGFTVYHGTHLRPGDEGFLHDDSINRPRGVMVAETPDEARAAARTLNPNDVKIRYKSRYPVPLSRLTDPLKPFKTDKPGDLQAREMGVAALLKTGLNREEAVVALREIAGQARALGVADPRVAQAERAVAWLEKTKNTLVLPRGAGEQNVYTGKVRRPLDHFIDWTKPVSEQSQYVQNIVRRLGLDVSAESRGADIYRRLVGRGNDVKPLTDAGFAGVRYPNRAIVFDRRNVDITHRNGVALSPKLAKQEQLKRDLEIAEEQERNRREQARQRELAAQEQARQRELAAYQEQIRRDRAENNLIDHERNLDGKIIHNDDSHGLIRAVGEDGNPVYIPVDKSTGNRGARDIAVGNEDWLSGAQRDRLKAIADQDRERDAAEFANRSTGPFSGARMTAGSPSVSPRTLAQIEDFMVNRLNSTSHVFVSFPDDLKGAKADDLGLHGPYFSARGTTMERPGQGGSVHMFGPNNKFVHISLDPSDFHDGPNDIRANGALMGHMANALLHIVNQRVPKKTWDDVVRAHNDYYEQTRGLSHQDLIGRNRLIEPGRPLADDGNRILTPAARDHARSFADWYAMMVARAAADAFPRTTSGKIARFFKNIVGEIGSLLTGKPYERDSDFIFPLRTLENVLLHLISNPKNGSVAYLDRAAASLARDMHENPRLLNRMFGKGAKFLPKEPEPVDLSREQPAGASNFQRFLADESGALNLLNIFGPRAHATAANDFGTELQRAAASGRLDGAAEARKFALFAGTGGHLERAWQHVLASGMQHWAAVEMRRNFKAAKAKTYAAFDKSAQALEPHVRDLVGAQLTDMQRAKALDPRLTWAQHPDAIRNDPQAAQLQAAHDRMRRRQDQIRKSKAGAAVFDAALRNGQIQNYQEMIGHMAGIADAYAKQGVPLRHHDVNADEGYVDQTQAHDDPSLKPALDYWKKAFEDRLYGITEHIWNEDQRIARAVKDRGLTGSDARRFIAAEIAKTRNLRDLKGALDERVKRTANSLYVPLGRSGKFFASAALATNPDGSIKQGAIDGLQKVLESHGLDDIGLSQDFENPSFFARVENREQMVRLAAALEEAKAKGHLDANVPVANGLKGNVNVFGSLGSLGSRMFQKLVAMATSAVDNLPPGVAPDVRQAILDEEREWFIDALPENSLLKFLQPREYAQGYSKKWLQSMAARHASSINSSTGMTTAPIFARARKAMRKEVEAAKSNPNVPPAQRTVPQEVANEILRREAESAIYSGNPTLAKIRSWIHSANIGFVPSYVFTATSQLLTLGHPELAKYVGVLKAAKFIAQKTPEAFRILRTLDYPEVSPREANMRAAGNISSKSIKTIIQADNDGMISSGGYTRNMATLAEGETHSTMQRLLHWANVLGSTAEILPRIIMALATQAAHDANPKAFNGMNAREAVKSVGLSQFDYGEGSSSRMLGNRSLFGSWTPISMGFMNFHSKMIEKLTMEARDAIVRQYPNESPDAARLRRQQATKFMLAHLAAATVLGGTLGLPFVVAFANAYDKLANTLTDRDDIDVQAQYRTWLANTFGKAASDVIAKGVSREGFGFDLSHLGDQSLVPFESFINLLTSKRKFEDAFGDFAEDWSGTLPREMVDFALGARDLFNGDYALGAQKILPAGLRGLADAYYLNEHGYVDRNGRTLPIKRGAFDVLKQALGLEPGKEAEYRDAAKIASGLMAQRQFREQTISQHLARGVLLHDPGEVQAWLAEAVRYQQQHPTLLNGPVTNFDRNVRKQLTAQNYAQALGVPIGINRNDVGLRSNLGFLNSNQ